MKDVKRSDGKIRINAYAKINLLLDVMGLREDGYHEVAMVMQTISLHDTVTVTRRTDAGVKMRIDFEKDYRAPKELLSADEDNLCVRAARLIRDTAGLENGYDIALTKRIPVGAGLAGGSTDAAAVLRAINELEELRKSDAALCELAASGGTRFALGTGTTLKDAPASPKLALVLIKPEVSMPTGKIYHDFDEMESPFHPDMRAMEKALAQHHPGAVAEALGNSLEPVVAAQFPVIEELKDALKAAGAMGAMMTGSGSCVYGIFDDEEASRKAAAHLREKYPRMFVCVSGTIGQEIIR